MAMPDFGIGDSVLNFGVSKVSGRNWFTLTTPDSLGLNIQLDGLRDPNDYAFEIVCVRSGKPNYVFTSENVDIQGRAYVNFTISLNNEKKVFQDRDTLYLYGRVTHKETKTQVYYQFLEGVRYFDEDGQEDIPRARDVSIVVNGFYPIDQTTTKINTTVNVHPVNQRHTLTYKWLHNSILIQEGSEIYTFSHVPTKADSGYYTLIVGDQYGEIARRSFEVGYQYKYVETETPPPNVNLIIECGTGEIPLVTIPFTGIAATAVVMQKWDGEAWLPAEKPFINRLTGNSTLTFYIDGIAIEQFGYYRASYQPSGRETFASDPFLFRYVEGKKVIPDYGLSITISASVTVNATVTEGRDVWFNAAVSRNDFRNNDTLLYKWYLNGELLTESPYYVGTTESRVTIKEIETIDAGSYHCQVYYADNDTVVDSSTRGIRVVPKPVRDMAITNADVSILPLEAVKNEPLKMTAQYTTNQKATEVEWQHRKGENWESIGRFPNTQLTYTIDSFESSLSGQWRMILHHDLSRTVYRQQETVEFTVKSHNPLVINSVGENWCNALTNIAKSFTLPISMSGEGEIHSGEIWRDDKVILTLPSVPRSDFTWQYPTQVSKPGTYRLKYRFIEGGPLVDASVFHLLVEDPRIVTVSLPSTATLKKTVPEVILNANIDKSALLPTDRLKLRWEHKSLIAGEEQP